MLVVMEIQDPEVILPSKDRTIATCNSLYRLLRFINCPTYITLHYTSPVVHLCDPKAVTLPLHSTPLEPTIHETPAHFETQGILPVSPGPPVQLPPFTTTDRPEIYNIIAVRLSHLFQENPKVLRSSWKDRLSESTKDNIDCSLQFG